MVQVLIYDVQKSKTPRFNRFTNYGPFILMHLIHREERSGERSTGKPGIFAALIMPIRNIPVGRERQPVLTGRLPHPRGAIYPDAGSASLAALSKDGSAQVAWM